MAAGEGFEPSHTESESAVLPLHKPAISVRYPQRTDIIIQRFFFLSIVFSNFFSKVSFVPAVPEKPLQQPALAAALQPFDCLSGALVALVRRLAVQLQRPVGILRCAMAGLQAPGQAVLGPGVARPGGLPVPADRLLPALCHALAGLV